MPRPPISRFAGQWRGLSNFARVPIRFDGQAYPTVEHAYQAAKAVRTEQREAIRTAVTPREAKQLGRVVQRREDWEAIKVNVMRNFLRQKFCRVSQYTELLLSTKDAELIEWNTWGDRFWGRCAGEGENWLGRLLMEIREELQQDRQVPGPKV